MSRPDWLGICDTWQPREGLLGLDIAPFPYISGLGCLIRALRLNEFARRDLHAVFGIRATQTLDVSQACHRPGKQRQHFLRALGSPFAKAIDYWDEQVWCPIDLDGRWNEIPHRPRHCPECLAFGYHCSLFQMPFVRTCPWHGKELLDACHCCGSPLAVQPDILGFLGRCICGHDLFDRRVATLCRQPFPTATATRILQAYLPWSMTEQRRRRLVAPTAPGCWVDALSTLVEVPPDLLGTAPNDRGHAGKLRVVTGATVPEPHAGAFQPWVVIGTSPQLKLANLPSRLSRPLTWITQRVVRIMAGRKRFGSDRIWLDGDMLILLHQDGVNERYILPVRTGAAAGMWIHLSAVAPSTLGLCGQLLDAVDRYICGPTEPDRWQSHESAKCCALDRVAGRRLLMAALHHLLLRGFADGLVTLLDAGLKQQQPRTARSRTDLPVLELRGSKAMGVEGIRVCWIDGRAPPMDRVNVAERRKAA